MTRIAWPVGALVFVAAFLSVTLTSRLKAAPDPSFKLDLRKIGYRVTGPQGGISDWTDLVFLSDDLLLVSINQMRTGVRVLGGVVGPGDFTRHRNRPESRLVLIDLNLGRVSGELRTTVAQRTGSVQAVSGQRFAVFDGGFVKICNRDLTCGAGFQSAGPLVVSPGGKAIAVGGDGRTPTTVIDPSTLKVRRPFEVPAGHGPQTVSPGDIATLVDQGPRVALRVGGGRVSTPDSAVDILEPRRVIMVSLDGTVSELPIGNEDRSIRFLSGEYLGYLNHRTSIAVIAGLDAKPRHVFSVETTRKSELIACLSESSVAIYEHGYTWLNSLLNFHDIDSGRPEDFERMRVFDLDSGAERARFEWDPQSYPIKPALSETGKKIARIRNGVLEVLQASL